MQGHPMGSFTAHLQLKISSFSLKYFFRKCCQNVVKMLSKRCHFQKVLKMLSKCCQNVVKMLSFLCLISSSFSAHFTLKEKCGKFIIRNVVKMLSFFWDPKRLHLGSIKAPFRLHFASPVPLGNHQIMY